MSGGSKGFRRLTILVGAVCAFFVFIHVFFNFGGISWVMRLLAVCFFLAGGLFTRLGGWVVRGFQEDREPRP
jgi:hypothetical protein